MNDVVRLAHIGDSQAMYMIKIAAHAGDVYASLIPQEYRQKFITHYTQSPEGEKRFSDKLQGMLNDDHYRVYVIEHDGRVGGYIMVHIDELKNRWSLDSLFIDPVMQGAGLGSRLIEHLLAEVDAPCELLVIAGNDVAINLYVKYGFSAIDNAAGLFYGAPLIKMERLLT